MMQILIHRKHKHRSSRSGEAGFTLIEMIIVIVLTSILGIFVFGALTKCLVAQIEMQKRKERSDDAIMALERINREFREANTDYFVITNLLMFDKRITSSADSNLSIKYQLNSGTLTRYSDTSPGAVYFSTTGEVIATNVTAFECSTFTNQRAKIRLEFADGSDWETNIYHRNFGL